MEATDIRPDTKMINKIHTLAVLRSEIQNYKFFPNEKRNVIATYAEELKRYSDKVEFYDQQLKKIRSAGGGDGIGGFVPESDVKFNELIEQKKKALADKQEWLSINNQQFYTEVSMWQSRIDTIEHYLSLMNDNDRQFIKDLYIDPIGFKNVMKEYKISNEGDVYRKAANILKKVLN